MKLPKSLLTCIITLFAALNLQAQQLVFADTAELFMPNLVSTKNADVKITFSPDGNKMLWGGIDWIEGKADQDIWQSDRVNGQWAKPERTSFDTDSNDFDPFFSPDGKGVYFFSNRLGGFGGDDIYFAGYNSKTNTYSAAVNLGSAINTKANEWAPITDAKAVYLVFSSGGHNSTGGQDMFKAKIMASGYGRPQNMGVIVNSADDDFDAALLPGNILIYTSAKGPDKKADLYAAYLNQKNRKAIKLPPQINAAEFWTFGPSINPQESGYLYFSSHHKNEMGRTDIYRIRYWVKDGK
jgi:TolB protein